MSGQTWQETYITAQIDGTALNTSTTRTSLLPAAAKFTLPANYFSIGRSLRISVRGRLSNINPTPGNLTLDVAFGSINVQTNTLALNTTAAKTNVTFEYETILTCRAIGAGTSANLMGIGSITSEAVALATTGVGVLMLPASAPAVGNGFDSTVAQTIDFLGTFSVSNAANSIQVHEYILESLN